jgi:hypothetical protein
MKADKPTPDSLFADRLASIFFVLTVLTIAAFCGYVVHKVF